jgi:hypothetical protein
MESYIITIYRAEEPDNRNFVGVVEKVGVEEKKGFTNLDELWTILNCGAADSCEETIPPLQRKRRF